MTNKELLEKVRELVDKKEKSQHAVCPGCGRCQHCGRGGYPYPWPYWVHPVQPWVYPYTIWSSPTVTGGLAQSATITVTPPPPNYSGFTVIGNDIKAPFSFTSTALNAGPSA